MDRTVELNRWLSEYEPADATEAEHLTAMRSLLAGTGDIFSRSRFDPGHFTASGVVLSPDGISLLMIHHARLARWLQPGGHVEVADSGLADAARREVSEETGVDHLTSEGETTVPFDLDVHTIPANNDTPEHRHFDVRFRFRAVRDRLVPASDAVDARWIPLPQVVELDVGSSIRRLVTKLLATPHHEQRHSVRGER